MKIDPNKLGLAGAAAIVVLWTVYNLIDFFLMISAVNLSGDFAYTNFADFDWQARLVKFILSVFALSFGAGLTGSLIADIYNFLIKRSDTKLP